MPIDGWLPLYDARSVHAVEIRASPDVVYQALLRTNFGHNPLVVTLMALRTIPALLLAPRRTLAAHSTVRRKAAGPMGHLRTGRFALLSDAPGEELIFGLTGRFWTLLGDLVPTDAATFTGPLAPGLARAAWVFHMDPLSGGRTRLTTETRVRCSEPGTRARFLRYWRVIRLGSGLIRRALLQQVKREAEAAGA